MGLISFIKGLFIEADRDNVEDVKAVEFSVNKSLAAKREDIDRICKTYENEAAILSTAITFLQDSEMSDQVDHVIKSMTDLAYTKETEFLEVTETLHNEVLEVEKGFAEFKGGLDTTQNENIDRATMPQLKDWVGCYDLMRFFMEHGVLCTPETVRVRNITFANAINVEKVSGMASSGKDFAKDEYFLSNDSIALDGNHRLATELVKNVDCEVKVYRCEEALDFLIDLLKKEGRVLLKGYEEDDNQSIDAPISKAIMSEEEFLSHVKVISDNKENMPKETFELAVTKIRTLAMQMGYRLAA